MTTSPTTKMFTITFLDGKSVQIFGTQTDFESVLKKLNRKFFKPTFIRFNTTLIPAKMVYHITEIIPEIEVKKKKELIQEFYHDDPEVVAYIQNNLGIDVYKEVAE